MRYFLGVMFPWNTTGEKLFSLFMSLLSAFIIVVLIALPFLFYKDAQERQASGDWCRDHGYKTAGVSERRGKSSVSTVLCIDDQRRLILPE